MNKEKIQNVRNILGEEGLAIYAEKYLWALAKDEPIDNITKIIVEKCMTPEKREFAFNDFQAAYC